MLLDQSDRAYIYTQTEGRHTDRDTHTQMRTIFINT